MVVIFEKLYSQIRWKYSLQKKVNRWGLPLKGLSFGNWIRIESHSRAWRRCVLNQIIFDWRNRDGWSHWKGIKSKSLPRFSSLCFAACSAWRINQQSESLMQPIVRHFSERIWRSWFHCLQEYRKRWRNHIRLRDEKLFNRIFSKSLLVRRIRMQKICQRMEGIILNKETWIQWIYCSISFRDG